MSLAKYGVSLCVYYSGVIWCIRMFRRLSGKKRILILAYHNFSDDLLYINMSLPADLFKEQMRYLNRYYRTMTCSRFLDSLENPESSWEDTVVITVDDGYASNYEPLTWAAQALGVASTVFVTTGCIDNREPPPVMRVMYAIHYATKQVIDLSDFGLGVLLIRTAEDKNEAIQAIDRCLKPLAAERRQKLVEQVIERAAGGDVVQRQGASAMLTWQQIQSLHRAGVEIGAHTITHPVLSMLTVESCTREIGESVRRVRQMVGVARVVFAYPYGGREEVDDVAVEVCRASGARGAVLLEGDKGNYVDLFKTPRKNVNLEDSVNPWGNGSIAMWACELEGIFEGFRKWKGGC